jgi:hypothetical protein
VSNWIASALRHHVRPTIFLILSDYILFISLSLQETSSPVATTKVHISSLLFAVRWDEKFKSCRTFEVEPDVLYFYWSENNRIKSQKRAPDLL